MSDGKCPGRLNACQLHVAYATWSWQGPSRCVLGDPGMWIGGSNFQARWNQTPYSDYFSTFPVMWGWATWRRARQFHDHDMKTWPQFKAEGRRRAICPDRVEAGLLEEEAGANLRPAAARHLRVSAAIRAVGRGRILGESKRNLAPRRQVAKNAPFFAAALRLCASSQSNGSCLRSTAAGFGSPSTAALGTLAPA